jgi:hypothetical protein
MATDHRGTPIHAGKRTNDEVHASRLAQLIATQNNRSWRDHGYYPSDGLDSTPEDVQKDLELYRNDRDTFGSDDFQVQRLGNAYGNAFKNRHDSNYATPMSYPFLEPNR